MVKRTARSFPQESPKVNNGSTSTNHPQH
ncbi:hypothetical protein E2C01_098153 [Portunus trituberculatus]|uniref:Uncharacterized protein n=1 Tax=Portunus trituberculatus TaxID=210409 RepID=A0A5B7K7I4_PORTR|nr:hypothetical protein [Portunus trituberculatus]